MNRRSREKMLRHVAIHEAGHAAVAIYRGIDFRCVTLSSRAAIEADLANGKAFTPGYVTPHRDDVNEWFAAGPEAALDFLVAGGFAEDRLLGGAMPGGFSVDIDRFKQGSGVIEFTPEEAAILIPQSLGRLESSWPDLEPLVRAIATHILGQFQAVDQRSKFEIPRHVLVELSTGSSR